MTAFSLGPAILFCPADRPDRYAKAAERADAVILDLEDAVAASAKGDARRALQETPLDPATTIVRMNALDTEDAAHDLEALAHTNYRYLMLPKAVSTTGLERFAVIALCETAAGVLAAPLLAATPNVIALMWGAEDLVASMGGTSSRREDGAYRPLIQHARAAVHLAAVAHGKASIDAVHLDIADAEGLEAEARDAAALGFQATACIHPSQVDVVRAAYAPSTDEIAHARRVLEAVAAQPHGVVSVDGRMVDEPVLRHAREVVRRAGG